METSLQTLASLAAFFFQSSLKTTVLILLILCIHRMLGKFLSANGRYLLWTTVMISLVMPFGFGVALPPGKVTEQRMLATAPAAETHAATAAVVELPRSVMPATDELAQAPLATRPMQLAEDTEYSWLALLPYAWLSGVMIVLGAIAVATLRFARLVRQATPAPEPLQRFLRECMEQTSCTRAPDLLHSAHIHVPMVAGLFKTVLLLPEGMEQQLTRAQLRHVFMHELMHLRRGDIRVNWIMALLQSLHWFNPVVWYAFACMRQDRELACDAATVLHLDASDRAAYGHTLLQLNDVAPQKPTPALAVGILESPAHLRQRILMLMQNPRYERLRFVFTAMLFVPLAAVAFSQPVPDSIRSPAAVPAVPAAVVPDASPVIAAPEAIAGAVTAPTRLTTAVPLAPAVLPAAEAKPAPAAALTLPAAAEKPLRPVTESRPVAPQDSLLLAQRAGAPDAYPVASPQTAPVTAALSAVEPASPVGTYDDMEYIQLLAEKIAAIQVERIGFIEKWNDMGMSCDARKDRPLGALSGACQKIRTALRRGEIFRFGAECFWLNSFNTGLYERYRETAAQQPAPAGVEQALRANESKLVEFCSKETYATRYPAFAAIFADAEAQKYSPSWRDARRPGALALQGSAHREHQPFGLDASSIPNSMSRSDVYTSLYVEPLAVPADLGGVVGSPP